MGQLSQTVLHAFRSFRDAFCESRHRWRIEKGICYESLRRLDGRLRCGEEERQKALDALAANMIDFIEKRIRHLMREEFDAIGGADSSLDAKAARFGKHVDFYDACYLQSLAEIERFGEEHPLRPVAEETLRNARSGYAHFRTLALAYLDMIVPGSGKAKGSS